MPFYFGRRGFEPLSGQGLEVLSFWMIQAFLILFFYIKPPGPCSTYITFLAAHFLNPQNSHLLVSRPGQSRAGDSDVRLSRFKLPASAFKFEFQVATIMIGNHAALEPPGQNNCFRLFNT